MGDTQVWLNVLIWALPSIIVFGLGMFAASDKRSRDRWSELLYHVGAISSAQRDAPKIQGSIRWPFMVVALLNLYWPVTTYIHATRKIDITSNLYQRAPLPSLYQKKADENAVDSAGNAVSNQAPAAGAAPAPPANIYGTPMPQ